MAAGIQYHFQDLYKRTFDGSVSRDFYGWWVRENWSHNGPPPVGSLYPTPMPNTCWNAYGIIGTVVHSSEFEQNARQEVAFQITSIMVTVHQVFNTCTEETEYYVAVSTTIRSSNQINTISYSRNEMTAELDTCYEFMYGIAPFVTETGTKTFSTLFPSWTASASPYVVHKYASLEAIPDTLEVDVAISPIEEVDFNCWAGSVCQPQYPLPYEWCLSPPLHVTPPAYICDATTVEETDECILSRIRLNTGDYWDVCNTIAPGDIPHAYGDMILRYCTLSCPGGGATSWPCGTSGFAGANSSVSSCDDLVYSIIQHGPDDSIGVYTVDGRVIVRRKASCSPLELIACDPYITWYAGGKTYPVTQSWRDYTHTKSRSVYSVAALCMNPTTFTLAAS